MTKLATGPLIVLTGPTGVGKTEVAIELAQALDGEVISADSAAVYSGLDVGSAKPSAKDRRRAAHHLLDIVRPGERFTLADWCRAAEAAVRQVRSAGRLPILAGGTGLYLRAYLEGYDFTATPPDARRRAQIERWLDRVGVETAYVRMARHFPKHVAQVGNHDAYRLVRAIERALMGLPPPQRRAYEPPAGVLGILLVRERTELYARIDRRASAQWQDDRLIQETRAALSAGACANSQALVALGYRQAVAYIQGRLSRSEAVRLTARDSRHFARRQLMFWRSDDWLRRVPAANAANTITALWRSLEGERHAADLHSDR